jgi:hypothetical protein
MTAATAMTFLLPTHVLDPLAKPSRNYKLCLSEPLARAAERNPRAWDKYAIQRHSASEMALGRRLITADESPSASREQPLQQMKTRWRVDDLDAFRVVAEGARDLRLQRGEGLLDWFTTKRDNLSARSGKRSIVAPRAKQHSTAGARCHRAALLHAAGPDTIAMPAIGPARADTEGRRSSPGDAIATS